ncbi:MAG: transposase [Xanthomonadales bacterium]|nr:transposase [Xanthomonadales bacterium]
MASPQLVKGRQHQPGAFYVATTVVQNRQPLLVSNIAAKKVIEQFQQVESEGLLQSIAWVVMPDHVHWLFRLGTPSLGTCMQRFKSRSAREINRRLERARGPIWQPGYYDHRLRDQGDLHAQARYILANPIRRGLSSQIGEYPYAWSRWGSDSF